MNRAIDDPVVIELADKLGKTPAQVVLSWVVQRGIVVLTKSVTPSRIKSNLEGEFEFHWGEEDLAMDIHTSKLTWKQCLSFLRMPLNRYQPWIVTTGTIFLRDWALISLAMPNPEYWRRQWPTSRPRTGKLAD